MAHKNPRYQVEFFKEKQRKDFEELINFHDDLSRTDAVAKAVQFYLLHSPYVRMCEKGK